MLLVVALADRFTGLVDLPAGYDALSSWWGIGALGALLVVEEVVDKVPGLDHANDVVMSVVRPAAGALLMLATTSDQLPPGVAMVLGLALAGTLHAAKAGARPALSVGTLGAGNPVASVLEDVVALAAAVVALAVPVLVVLVLAALLGGAAWILARVGRTLARSDR